MRFGFLHSLYIEELRRIPDEYEHRYYEFKRKKTLQKIDHVINFFQQQVAFIIVYRILNVLWKFSWTGLCKAFGVPASYFILKKAEALRDH